MVVRLGRVPPYSMSLSVVNKAIGGRSARSYTVEGRFDEIVGLVKAGDVVIIELVTTMVARSPQTTAAPIALVLETKPANQHTTANRLQCTRSPII